MYCFVVTCQLEVNFTQGRHAFVVNELHWEELAIKSDSKNTSNLALIINACYGNFLHLVLP